ncbi:hypothetical protein Ancab_022450 [Ancistrocladus abbreviatus]
MGQQQSKDELVYQQVVDGNTEAIKALRREGAGLEWMDKEGKTPLIVACMDARLYIVAKTLIELGANVNAYRPGRHAGTPLHHSAKRGLDQTVRLLLSYRANAFVRNDDCQTPLEVARAKGFNNVVRAIEAHICYFSGHIREIFGPSFLEALAPQLLSRKIWVVVVPSSPHNPPRPPKLELVIYHTPQDTQPRTVIALSKAKIEEPKFHLSDPTLIIFDQPSRTRFKFASAIEGDKQQIQLLFNACKGICQVMPSLLPTNAGTSASFNEVTTEAAELAAGINASIQSAAEHIQSAADSSPQFPLNPSTQTVSSSNGTNGWGGAADSASNEGVSLSRPPPSAASTSGWMDEPAREDYKGWGVPDPKATSSQPTRLGCEATAGSPVFQTTSELPEPVSATPSAPPLPDDDTLLAGPIHYPTIDLSPVDFSAPAIKNENLIAGAAKDNSDSSCVICWEAPVEGACIPCGHMAGCMPCLKEIKEKKGVCPVCRANIEQVIKVYAV